MCLELSDQEPLLTIFSHPMPSSPVFPPLNSTHLSLVISHALWTLSLPKSWNRFLLIPPALMIELENIVSNVVCYFKEEKLEPTEVNEWS